MFDKTYTNYSTDKSFTKTSNTEYIRLSTTSSQLDLIQLELGSTATTYQSYTKSDLYLQSGTVGYRLPNGVRDTIEIK